MSIEIRALTNSYQDCRLFKLDPNDPKSPLVVAQQGYAPGDSTCRSRLFFLQRDGLWIDEIARSTRPDTELRDVIFDSSTEALQALANLAGRPMVRELPVKQSDVQAYASRVGGGTPESIARDILARYRGSQAKA
jgi:hypothetical protein